MLYIEDGLLHECFHNNSSNQWAFYDFEASTTVPIPNGGRHLHESLGHLIGHLARHREEKHNHLALSTSEGKGDSIWICIDFHEFLRINIDLNCFELDLD